MPKRHADLIRDAGSAAIDRRDGALDVAVDACRRFSEWPWQDGLYLSGEVGCGKSLLACLTLRGMILQAQEVGWPVVDGMRISPDEYRTRSGGHITFWYPMLRFVNTPRLLNEIKATYNRQSAYDPSTESVLREYVSVDVLVLDDLGSEKPTDWVREQLFMIIDERYGARRPTIFTSNFDLATVGEYVSPRIADRILEMCRGRIIKINCGSYR